MTDDLPQEQVQLRRALTLRNFCNLKPTGDGKFAGIKVEDGKKFVYTGLEITGDDVKFETRASHEKLEEALGALAAVKVKPAAMAGFENEQWEND